MSILVTESFELMHCATCGISNCITPNFRKRRMDDGQNFYCPSGHINVYSDTLEEKLAREQKARVEADGRRIAAETRERAVIVEKNRIESSLKKLKVRVKNGVCPCCHRSFENIKSHIKTKHPNFK